MTINNGRTVFLDIVDSLSILGLSLVYTFIIIIVLVFYSCTRHQRLFFIFIAEMLSLGWLTHNIISVVFIFPIVTDLMAFTTLLNIVSVFIRVISSFLFILGLHNQVQDLTAFQSPSKGKRVWN